MSRTVTVTLPNGKIVKRESMNRIYTHAAIVRDVNRRIYRDGQPPEIVKNGPSEGWFVAGFSSSADLARKALAKYKSKGFDGHLVKEVQIVEKATKAATSQKAPTTQHPNRDLTNDERAQLSQLVTSEQPPALSPQQKAWATRRDRAAIVQAEMRVLKGAKKGEKGRIDAETLDAQALSIGAAVLGLTVDQVRAIDAAEEGR